MLFYIIIGFMWGIALPGVAIMIYHRNLPVIATRDLPLTFLSFFCLMVAHTLCLVSYEFLFHDMQAFQKSCIFLVDWPTGISNSLCFVRFSPSSLFFYLYLFLFFSFSLFSFSFCFSFFLFFSFLFFSFSFPFLFFSFLLLLFSSLFFSLSLSLIICSFLINKPVLCRAFNVQFKYYMNYEKQNEKMEASFYFKYKKYATYKYYMLATVAIFLLFNVPTLIVFLTVPLPDNPTNTTECFGYFTYLVLGQSSIQAIFLNYLVHKFWNLVDPYNIKTEFVILLSTGYLSTGAWMVLQLIDTIKGSTLFPKGFEPLYFLNTSIICIILAMVCYPVYLIYLEKKKGIYGNSSPHPSDIHLHNILSNEEYLQVFREVTIQYWCVESLMFVVDVERYKLLLDESQREEAAKTIFNTYFKSESPLHINVNASTINSVQERIKSRDFVPTLFSSATS